ncbi:MAG: DUF6084 family protein [Bryobacteraceae bacterium]
MPDLTITVAKVEAVQFAATPSIAFEMDVQNSDPHETIYTVVLRCQIQLEVARRKYTAPEQEKLRDLFGEPERWGQTLRSLLWTHASVVAPQFTGRTTISMPVACTFDFNVAATKYFSGLSEGDIPLCLMFSGTVFYEDAEGSMRVAPISWDKEARFRLPLKVWQDMMDLYYPNTAWISLRRDVFDQLQAYKVRHGIPSWEQALERILAAAEDSVKV